MAIAVAASPRYAAVSISVGGVVVRFESADPSVVLSVHGIRPAFQVDETIPPDCVVTCDYGDPVPSGTPVVAQGASMWEMRHTDDGAEEVTFFAPQGHTRVAWAQTVFDSATRSARLIQRRGWGGGDAVRIGYPVDELLMCRLLMGAGAVIVHGAAVEYDGRALLFVGHSGAGKSTISALAQECGARVLSDDRTILRVAAAGVTAWGTPWHGSHRAGSPTAQPLDGIFLLVQAARDDVRPLAPTEAAGELLVRLIHPGASRQQFETLVGRVADVVSQVPVFELRFRPTVAAFRLAADVRRNEGQAPAQLRG
ncbi:MAG: hypothetical protein ACT4PJ_06155 [Gemmatimonadaceae bacterium]